MVGEDAVIFFLLLQLGDASMQGRLRGFEKGSHCGEWNRESGGGEGRRRCWDSLCSEGKRHAECGEGGELQNELRCTWG